MNVPYNYSDFTQSHAELRKVARQYVLELLSHRTNSLPQDQADALADEAKHWSRRKSLL